MIVGYQLQCGTNAVVMIMLVMLFGLAASVAAKIFHRVNRILIENEGRKPELRKPFVGFAISGIAFIIIAITAFCSFLCLFVPFLESLKSQ